MKCDKCLWRIYFEKVVQMMKYLFCFYINNYKTVIFDAAPITLMWQLVKNLQCNFPIIADHVKYFGVSVYFTRRLGVTTPNAKNWLFLINTIISFYMLPVLFQVSWHMCSTLYLYEGWKEDRRDVTQYRPNTQLNRMWTGANTWLVLFWRDVK